MANEVATEWGVIPEEVVSVARLLSEKVARASKRFESRDWPKQPGDVQDTLRLAVGDAHAAARASTDLRSLLTAYAHQFHQPRPVMADIARAQDTSRQGIPRRYSATTVEAIAELLADQPNTALVLHAFPSLTLTDLTKLNGPIGEVAKRQRDGDLPFISYAQQKRQASEAEREANMNAFRESLSKARANRSLSTRSTDGREPDL